MHTDQTVETCKRCQTDVNQGIVEGLNLAILLLFRQAINNISSGALNWQ